VTLRQWRTEVKEGRNPRAIKVLFAQEIVERFHGSAAAKAAHEEFEQRFRHGVLPEDMPVVTLRSPNDGLPIAQVLKQAGLVPSVSEAARMIEQGGVKLDGEKVADKALKLASGTTVVAQVGKRRFARITIE
jgi:tyrosyl-tRNA synthetase